MPIILCVALYFQDPNLLIQWYNDVIDWMADIATHSVLRRLSWPAHEFSHTNDGV